MLNFDEGEEVFFDCVDCFSFEDSVVVKQELAIGNSDYEIWMKEPQSVKERREKFLVGMGFDDICLPTREAALERLADCSGVVLSSSAYPSNGAEETSISGGREVDSEANPPLDESDKPNVDLLRESTGNSTLAEENRHMEAQGPVEESKEAIKHKKKSTSWWKRLLKKHKSSWGVCASEVSVPNTEASEMNPMKVRQNKKTWSEFSAVYMGQEIQAHKGFIWAMKFSPDGQYLASGGEDGIVRIWRVTSVDASPKCLAAGNNCGVKEGKSTFGRKKSSRAAVVVPEKIFQIEKSPLQELHGHAGDVLDLAWSKSNYLLSSSKDKTVRLWQVGHDKCLNVFRHNGYVTCIQFNPVDDNYFISGSIDRKVRIWGVTEGRVADWADVRDVVTAISFRPDGKGFVAGSISGTCHFYESSGNHFRLGRQVNIDGRKKASGNKITGIQFSQEEPHIVMITSEDSKVRILDGVDVIHKYRGLRKSGSQMSASFTSTGRHIVSVGEDSRVYVWNYDGLSFPLSKPTKSVRSCEHFFFEGVSVAAPWSGMATEQQGACSHFPRCLPEHDRQGAASRGRESSERFSLSSWFSLDGPCRGSATWPEEKLPLWDVPVAEHDNHHEYYDLHHQQQQQWSPLDDLKRGGLSKTWGLVIVTASWDGTIRTFHNYGLPVRL